MAPFFGGAYSYRYQQTSNPTKADLGPSSLLFSFARNLLRSRLLGRAGMADFRQLALEFVLEDDDAKLSSIAQRAASGSSSVKRCYILKDTQGS